MTTGKPKVHKTNRILLKHGYVIYCSCDIIREVRDHLIRVNQRMSPKKGEHDILVQQLHTLANDPAWADHFPNSSKRILGASGSH